MSDVLKIAMNGVTGRMGYRQHLVRSILAIRDEGGLLLPDGTRHAIEPILVGRNPAKLAELADRHDIDQWSTELEEVLADPSIGIYFDAQVTSARRAAVAQAISAGKHVYAEKPIAATCAEAISLAQAATERQVTVGVVHDKLYLPGLLKLRRLVEAGFFGRVLSVRGEFGYWVFEGDWQESQRPSWNYRAADGGGMVLDMFPHWSYVLEGTIAPITSVYAQLATHIPQRTNEHGQAYPATADDAAYAIFELEGGVIAQMNSSWAVRVHRDELVEFQVDGTEGSAVAGLFHCRSQSRVNTPRATWNPDLPDPITHREHWAEVPMNGEAANGFRAQWEEFLTDVLLNRPHRHGFLSGARGLQLAEAGYQSHTEGRRITLTELAR